MDMRNNPCFMLLVLFLFLSLNSSFSHGADTISTNQSLSGDQTIVSRGGVFVLGFFKPGKSSNFYIGMWYKQVSPQTIVWVANRDRPVSDKYSSELKILNGNLVLSESQTPIWSTNLTSTTSKSIQAVLHDTGNLVLSDGSNSSEPLWQSFDYPTHTWLPGSKIGLDKRTKTNQLLTSWKNSEDPASGLFSLELDPNGTSQYYIVWNRSEKKYWTSGTWDGHIFRLVPEMNLNYMYNLSYVSNKNESYFIYTVTNPNIISRFVMDVSGQIKQLSWLPLKNEWFLFWAQPRRQCEVYALCGMFSSCNEKSMPFCNCLKGFEPKSLNDWNLNDYSGGCVRKTPLQCGNNITANGQSDRFLVSSSLKLPEQAQFVPVGSAVECESTCLNNCSCTAYAYDNNRCSVWFGGLFNLRQPSEDDGSGKTLHIRLAASEFSSPNNNTGTVIGIVVGSVAGVVALLGIVLVVFLRRRRSFGTTKLVEGSLVPFEYRYLQNATKNFSEKLGRGGFGSVFKGTLPDSTVIAVKKLESISQGEKQFRTEVSTIGTIQHVNLIRLRGFSSKGTQKLLVYEYMPNGSLDACLFHEKDSKILDWKTRYQIALEIARGLAYLHEKCRDCIIHCDIKPENILLDAEFCPKVQILAWQS